MSFFSKSLIVRSQTHRIRATFLSRFFASRIKSDYDERVSIAALSGDFDELQRLLSRRVRDGCYNTAKTFDFVTKTSEQPINTLFEALSTDDKGYARKSAYDALIVRLCRIGRVEDSLRAIDAMARAGCALSAKSFNPAIDALARGSELGAAWRVVDKMRVLGVAPDAQTFNALLLESCAAGDVAASAATAERMVESGAKPNARTYDALVLCACKVGRVEGALALLRRMEDEGVTALLSTRLYVVDALLGLGYYDMAVRFVRVYARGDTWLDQESYRCLANRFVRLKKSDKARLVLEEMRERGFVIKGSWKDLPEKEVEDAAKM